MIWKHISRKWKLHFLSWWDIFNSNKDILVPSLVEKQRHQKKTQCERMTCWHIRTEVSSPHPESWQMEDGRTELDRSISFSPLGISLSCDSCMHPSDLLRLFLTAQHKAETNTTHWKRTGWKSPRKPILTPSQHLSAATN